jgi:hypothetical protein
MSNPTIPRGTIHARHITMTQTCLSYQRLILSWRNFDTPMFNTFSYIFESPGVPEFQSSGIPRYVLRPLAFRIFLCTNMSNIPEHWSPEVPDFLVTYFGLQCFGIFSPLVLYVSRSRTSLKYLRNPSTSWSYSRERFPMDPHINDSYHSQIPPHDPMIGEISPLRGFTSFQPLPFLTLQYHEGLPTREVIKWEWLLASG